MNLLGKLCVSVLCGLTLALPARADIISGRVVGIADGDTVTVLDGSNRQHKIRLMGIDAPEKKMPYGNHSKQSLSALIFGKDVSVQYAKRDKYQRIVGKITVGGLDANLAQVKAGMAWHYKQYQSEQSAEDSVIYARAEREAQASNRGLWKDSDPVAPWDWRRSKKRN